MCVHSTSIILSPPAGPRIPIAGSSAFSGGSEGKAESELTDDRRHGIEGEPESETVTEPVSVPQAEVLTETHLGAEMEIQT